jgi:nucleoside-diphosphate-sugar epimerase
MNHHDVLPAYYPLDEKIPSDVDDWYSLSKQNDENTARMAWRHWGIDVVSLRFPHVNTADVLRRQADGFRENPGAGVREGWSYLDTRDAAYAIELGLTAELSGQHTLFVAASTTNAPFATEDLLDAFAPGVPRLRRMAGREVPIDLNAARDASHLRPALAGPRRRADPRGQGDRDGTAGHPAGGGPDRHHRTRPVRAGLRDVHPALEGGADVRRRAPGPLAGRALSR